MLNMWGGKAKRQEMGRGPLRLYFAALSVHYCVNMLKAIESLCFGKIPELIVMYRLPFNKLWASYCFLSPAFHSIDPQKQQGWAASLHPSAAPMGPAAEDRPLPEPPHRWVPLQRGVPQGWCPPILGFPPLCPTRGCGEE